MTTLAAFLVAILVLVVFHELGHLWVARLCNVKVLRFSVGFGKVLYSKRFAGGETEWVISAVPLGGYVKMLDEREGEVAAEELPRAFNRQPVLRRMAIVVAGPLANLLLAIVLYWGLFVHGVPGLKPKLGEVDPATPAAIAQLQAQQTILSINGQATPSWQDVRWSLLDLVLQGKSAALEVQDADGDILHRELNLGSLSARDLDSDFMLKLGMRPYQPPVYAVIGELLPGGVAQQAGLESGDVVQRIDGLPIKRWDEFVVQIRNHPGKPMQLEILRDGTSLTLQLTPLVTQENGVQIGKIGAGPKIDEQAFVAMLAEVRYPPGIALTEAIRKTWDTSVVSLQMIGRMIIGQVSLKNLSGPITIADYAGQSAHMGIGAYIAFLALISISLGVLNLLPIPLLDGGHLLYYTAELIKGSPVSDRLWEAGQNVGIALLVTIMAFALYNDISRLILG
ncbi:MAG TPA: RIP metalloprotease RseP [Gallionellaceae bacterium]|nr:RIP metalloprotease RseP [Gallionellaceae bacterium]